MPYPARSEEDKSLLGTRRNDRRTPEVADIVLLEELPDTPAFLDKNGRKHWKNYTKLLQKQGNLAENFLSSLGRYCFLLQVCDEAAEELKKGVVREYKDDNGRIYFADTPNLLKIFKEASADALKFEVQFGFTPLSRKQVPVTKRPKETRLSKLKQIGNQ